MLLDVVLRIAAAGLVGLIVGIATKSEPGARLFGIVSMGAALLAVVSTEFFKILALPWIADPGRLTAQIISALGFIGSGLIWLGDDKQVQGVGAAAALWLTAILGLVIGTGASNVAIGATLFVVLILILNQFTNLEKIRTAMEKAGLGRSESDEPKSRRHDEK